MERGEEREVEIGDHGLIRFKRMYILQISPSQGCYGLQAVMVKDTQDCKGTINDGCVHKCACVVFCQNLFKRDGAQTISHYLSDSSTVIPC